MTGLSQIPQMPQVAEPRCVLTGPDGVLGDRPEITDLGSGAVGGSLVDGFPSRP